MGLDRRDVLRSLAIVPAAWHLRGLELDGFGGSDRAASRTAGALPARLRDLRPRSSSGGRTLSEPEVLPAPVAMLGIQAPRGADVAVRTGLDPLRLSTWKRLPLLGDEGEGPDGEEAATVGEAWQTKSVPLWTGTATVVQVSVAGAALEDVEVLLLPADDVTGAGDADVAAARLVTTAPRHPTPPPSVADEPEVIPAVGGLRVVTRREWGANESWRGAPSYADRVRHGIVHHTVNSNSYSRSQGPALVRSIYRYHTQTLGWKDIGYNLLVDRYGVIYEGRFGGIDRPVIGAHAQGANSGSFGVAVIGDFRTSAVPAAARQAILELLVAKFRLHGIDAGASLTANGRRVSTLAGHRDVGSTSCPGGEVARHFSGWRRELRRRVSRGFSDISGHPHEESIRRLHRLGVTSGYPDGTFRPDEHVDRAQMATFITRAAKLRPGGRAPFRDVTPNHPHHDGIAAVVAAGVAQGYPNGTYRPSVAVTRAQMAAFLARARGLSERVGLTFIDVLPTHPHHGVIEAVAHAGIAQGYGDRTFGPERPVTRGQMATFLVRAF
jgi:hypothetical protein